MQNWHIVEVETVQIRKDPGYEDMLEVSVILATPGDALADRTASLTLHPAELATMVNLAVKAGQAEADHSVPPSR